MDWIRGLGGTSAVWAGWMRPLREVFFDACPINLKELISWYEKAAVFLGRDKSICHHFDSTLPNYYSIPFSVGAPSHFGEGSDAEIWGARMYTYY